MFSWFRRIQAILDKEPETWISYLNGQHLENFSHLKEVKPRLRGTVLRIAVFFFRLIQDTRLKAKPQPKSFVIYAGTANQHDAMAGTVSALTERGCEILAITNPRTYDKRAKNLDYRKLYFSPFDIVKTAILLIFRYGKLRRSLNGRNRVLLTNKLDSFCKVYSHLAYFERLLRDSCPNYIIVSNDHNVSNRALIAVADELGIDTVYMQHASVSSIFPALNFKYAFLDGLAAAETYRMCENNHPPRKPPRRDRHIYLSGQKKRLVKNNSQATHTVGIALNALDRPADVSKLLTFLEDEGIVAKVRWHPGLQGRALEPLLKVIQNREHISESDPKEESVAGFLTSIEALVAGNSSIHLEAALLGVVPIYYEFGPAENQDYYGYVKSGISAHATSSSELIELLHGVQRGELRLAPDKIQYFSATFGTEWEGREDELLVQNLFYLSQGTPPQDLFGYASSAYNH